MDSQKSVLILDPSTFFRQTLKEVIQTCEPSVDVSESNSADRLKERLLLNPPDVVFLDIVSPSDYGIQLIEEVKAVSPDTRVVVLTTHDSPEHKRAALVKGADFFLSKISSGGLRLLKVIDLAIHQPPPAPPQGSE